MTLRRPLVQRSTSLPKRRRGRIYNGTPSSSLSSYFLVYILFLLNFSFFVRNADVRIWPISRHSHPIHRRVSSSFCLWALARVDENADASQVIFEPPPESWRRTPGRTHTTWMKTTQRDPWSYIYNIRGGPKIGTILVRLNFIKY